MHTWRNRQFLLGDVIILPTALYASYVLRLDRLNLRGFWGSFALAALLVIVLTPLIFYLLGIYARYWRFASVEELLLLAGGVVAVVAALVGGHELLDRALVGNSLILPRSVPVIFLALAVPATAAPRLAARRGLSFSAHPSRAAIQERVLVIGAGQAGTMTVRELRRNPQLGLNVVGFLDDDPAKQSLRIAGVPVLGHRTSLPTLVARHTIARVIIAMPTAHGQIYRETVDLCQRVGVRVQTLPGLYELLGGAVSVRQMRDVRIEDLLRRTPIRTDLAAVRELLCGKRVLITGAGGSIGGELARQVLRCRPSKLVLLGHGENSIFEIHGELLRQLGQDGHDDAAVRTLLYPVIADTRSAERLRAVFAFHRPEIVFHAAAHKHVPLMEENQTEAVTNNIMGTRNALDAALATGVERFVMVSTDKAVSPTSVMGATKRIAELLVHQAAAEHRRNFMVTRFGNVLGSRGSVVLTMQRQIAAGGPVTVTHPEMTRYFMTIPEAVQLVLQAVVLGRGGEAFVFDMGEPVSIANLARDLIRLSGAEKQGIEIVYSGIRPGEKLHENLFTPEAVIERTCHDQIFVASITDHSASANLTAAVDALELAAQQEHLDELMVLLQCLLPESQLFNSPQKRHTAAPRSPGMMATDEHEIAKSEVATLEAAS